MLKEYILEKINNNEKGKRFILLKKGEQNILLSETEESIKLEELGKESNYYFKNNKKAMEILKKDLGFFKKIAEETSLNKLYIDLYLYRY